MESKPSMPFNELWHSVSLLEKRWQIDSHCNHFVQSDKMVLASCCQNSVEMAVVSNVCKHIVLEVALLPDVFFSASVLVVSNTQSFVFFSAVGETATGVWICAIYQRCGPCDWEAEISIKRCPDGSYAYQLVAPPACPIAYCVGDFLDCDSGELWDPDANAGNGACIGMNILLSFNWKYLFAKI